MREGRRFRLPLKPRAPRLVPGTVCEPAKLLFPSPPVLLRTDAGAVVGMPVPLAPAAFHIYTNE